MFGKVIQGMDVADKIAATPTGLRGPFPSDVPKSDVVIEDIRLIAAESLPIRQPFHKIGENMIKLHTNYGDITLELDSEKAPINGPEFHRLREQRTL